MLTYADVCSHSEWVDEDKHASRPSRTLTPRDPLQPPPPIPEGVSCGPTVLVTVGEEIVVRSARLLLCCWVC